MKKKKDHLNCLKKICKFIFINLIIYGIIVGVISGSMVAFLFFIPKLSLTNTIVEIKDDKIYFRFDYENKGQSPAINIEHIIKYAILYENEERVNDGFQEKQDKFEAGDIIKHSFWIDFIKVVEKNIFENSEIIILCKVKYEDSCKFRNYINMRLLNNQYTIYRLAFYDVSKKRKSLSVLSLEKRNEFKEMIDKWIEELENGVSNYDQTRTREI